MVERLLSLGVDARVSADHARTVLHDAAAFCTGTICSLLLDAGADLEIACDQGTPLARAARFGNADAAAMLLQRGARCTNEVISAAQNHNHFAVLALLRAHDAQASGWLTKGTDAFTALRSIARELGTAAARSAHDSGDYAHYQDIGNDVDELCGAAWQAAAMTKLSAAISTLDDATRQALPDRPTLLEQLENEFTDAYFEEI